MQPEDLLNAAAQTLAERGQGYDRGQQRLMEQIVLLFNVASGRLMQLNRALTEDEGWLFMQCLKLARIQQKKGFDADSFLDLAAYTALRAEARAKREAEQLRNE